MNVFQEAKLTMTKGVVQNFDDNPLLVALVPALQTAITELKEKVAAVDTKAQITSEDLTGITVDKRNFRENLCASTLDAAELIYAYAAATSNNTLKQDVNLNKSKLQKQRDGELIRICQIVHDRGMENLDALKDYGVSAGMLTDLQKAIDDFSDALIKPITARGKRKTETNNLVELFEDMDFILHEKIDKLMGRFRATNPDFYETHFNLRKIKDPSTTTTQLKGKITDAETNLPIKGATITVVELNKSTVTDSLGEYAFKPIENGKFTVRVTKEGYQTFETDEVEIKVGDIKHLDMSLNN